MRPPINRHPGGSQRRLGAAAALAIWLSAVCGAIVPVSAQDVTADRPAARHPYALHVADAARRFGIPETWIWAVMRVESNGNSRAVSSAGAMGLMQIMPATWADLRARYGLGADPFDVRDNIMAGAAYLRLMHDRYGNATAMLGAYNAGPGRYDEHLARGRPLPAETRTYLARLASIAGDAPAAQVAVAPPPDPLAWRRAALFVRVVSAADAADDVREDGEIAAPGSSADALSPSSPTARVTDALPPQSAATDTLFVPRVVAGRPQ